MKGVSTTRNGGARAISGKTPRCPYGMGLRSAKLNGTEQISVPRAKGK
jgi:hypothetical protein